MPHYPTHKEKSKRAFRAYMDLLDTAEWIKGELRGPLASFDLAMGDFRVLEMLYREGALFLPDIARKRKSHRQGIDVIVGRARETRMGGAEGRETSPVDFERAHMAAGDAGRAAGGEAGHGGGPDRNPGKKLMGSALPRHSKVVQGAHARAQCDRAGFVGPPLPEIARGRCGEVCPGDHARGCRGLS